MISYCISSYRPIYSRLYGLLYTGIKVFHVIGPAYAGYYQMLDFEIEKYHALAREEIV